MRYSLLLAGPVAVSAQALSTITGRVQTATISDGSEVAYTTTWTYSNPATNYLSLTDSEGVSDVNGAVGTLRLDASSVVTGMPSNTAATLPAGEQPEAVTSQPAVATIPAGLPTGVTQILYNGTAGFTSFSISVGPSSTVVIGGNPTDASVTTGGSSAGSTGSSGSGSGSNSNSGNNSDNSDSDSSSDSPSSSESAGAQESGNAASSVRVAGAGIGLFAFIAALL